MPKPCAYSVLRSGGSRNASTKRSRVSCRIVEQLEHALLALDGADRLRVLGPLDLALVVGRRRDLAELGRAAGPDVGGQVRARAVEQREVLRRVDRDPRERLARLGDVVADLEQVAHDERDRRSRRRRRGGRRT